jgi:hypothetical protein
VIALPLLLDVSFSDVLVLITVTATDDSSGIINLADPYTKLVLTSDSGPDEVSFSLLLPAGVLLDAVLEGTCIIPRSATSGARDAIAGVPR